MALGNQAIMLLDSYHLLFFGANVILPPAL